MGGPYGPGHELDSMGALSFSNALRTMQAGRMTPFQAVLPQGALSPAVAGHALAKGGHFTAAPISAADKVEAVRGNDIMYGVDSGVAGVAAGVQAVLTVAPQKRHVPVRIVMTQNTANSFVVNAISVGVEPILATVGAISAAIFVQDATAPDFRAVICEVGNTFNITVTNITGANQRFTATVVGAYLPWYLGG